MEIHYKYIKASILFAALFAFSIHSFGQTLTWYQDADGDGWGNAAISISIDTIPKGYVLNNKDCNDSQYNQTQWNKLGNSMILTQSYESSFAVSPSGVAYIAYNDVAHNYNCTVKKFDGTNWITVGSAGFSNKVTASNVSIAFDTLGIPYVAYQEDSSFNFRPVKGYVMKYNGTSWIAVGNACFSRDSFSHFTGVIISLVIDKKTNTPYVAYADRENAYKATVKKYDGSSWVTVGNAGFSDAHVTPSLAISKAGVLYIAYSDSIVSNRVTVKKFDSTGWVTVGRQGFAGGVQNGMSLTLDNDGAPYVTTESDYPWLGGPTVRKFVDTGWVTLGWPTLYGAPVNEIDMAMDASGIPYVAYADLATFQNATVRKYGEDKWNAIGNLGFSDSAVQSIKMCTDAAGIPYILYSFYNDSTKLNYYSVMKAAPKPLDVEIGIQVSYSSTNATFSSKSVNGGSSPTYQWYKNGSLVSGANASTYTTALNNHDTIYCRLIGNDPCATTLAYSNKISTTQITWYRDADNDGMGDPATTTSAFIKPSGYVLNKMDCDDTKPNVQSWNNIGEKYTVSIQNFSYISIGAAVDPNGISYIIYADSIQEGKATVRKYDGTKSVVVGNAGFSDNSIFGTPHIVLDPLGNIYVAYSDMVLGPKVLKYDGVNWIDLNYNGPDVSDMVFDRSGTLYICWTAKNFGEIVAVVKYDGTSWSYLGKMGFTNGAWGYVDMVVDPITKTPYIAYINVELDEKITVMKFDGSKWVIVGTDGFTPSGVYDFDLTVDATTGTPYIAYVVSDFPENKISVMKYDGGWISVGDSDLKKGASEVRIAIDPTGTPYIAYNGDEIGAMKFDGTNWVSASDTGIAGNSNEGMAELLIDATGVPAIAYKYDGMKTSLIRPTLQLLNDSIRITVSDTTITSDSVTYTAVPLYGGTTPAYQWYKNDTLINGINSSTYTAKKLTPQDTISCVMVSDYACAKSTPVYSNRITGITVIPPDTLGGDTTGGDSTVGINNLYSTSTRISLYPIPAREILNIQWNNKTTGSAIINVYDMTGKEVLKGTYTLTQTRETVSLPVNGLAPGAYFVKAILNGQPLAPQKFLKN